MKPFLLLVLITFSQTLIGQKTIYFTAAFNYADFTHSDYHSNPNFQQTISKANMKPFLRLGAGYRVSVTKRFGTDLFISANRMTGKANYSSSSIMNIFEGTITYKLFQLQFAPGIYFELEDKVTFKVDLLSSLNIFNNPIIGTSTEFGYYDNGFHQYPTPIVIENIMNNYTDLPWLSTGISTSISFELNDSFELFGRYIYEQSVFRGDFFDIHQFAFGANYLLNPYN